MSSKCRQTTNHHTRQTTPTLTLEGYTNKSTAVHPQKKETGQPTTFLFQYKQREKVFLPFAVEVSNETDLKWSRRKKAGTENITIESQTKTPLLT